MPDQLAQDRRQEILSSVVVGEDGFLFHRYDDAFEQLCGQFRLSRRQTERWLSTIETREAWCRARGIGFYMVIVPEKHVIYADKLPPGFKISPDRPAKAIVAALDPDVRDCLIYPEGLLRAGRAVEHTYHRTDVHWTEYGGFLVYAQLVRAMRPRIGAEPIAEEEIVRGTRRRVGDLGIMLDSEPDEEMTTISHPLARLHPRLLGNSAFRAGQVEVFENAVASALPRAVIFRDSGATVWLPFLSAHFARMTVLASSRVFYDLIRSERPDVVIVEIAERYLARPWPHGDADAMVFSGDTDIDDFVSFSGVALPLPTPVKDLVVDFGAAGNGGSYVGPGWSGPEAHHRWMTGNESALVLPAHAGIKDYLVDLQLTPCTISGDCVPQRLEVAVNGTAVGSHVVDDAMTIQLRVPRECVGNDAMLRFSFRHPDFKRPIEFGGTDPRELSVAFQWLRLQAR